MVKNGSEVVDVFGVWVENGVFGIIMIVIWFKFIVIISLYLYLYFIK